MRYSAGGENSTVRTELIKCVSVPERGFRTLLSAPYRDYRSPESGSEAHLPKRIPAYQNCGELGVGDRYQTPDKKITALEGSVPSKRGRHPRTVKGESPYG